MVRKRQKEREKEKKVRERRGERERDREKIIERERYMCVLVDYYVKMFNIEIYVKNL